ncbi:hypothetical protein RJ640_016905 [Escallonia rubra]|uniref:F-box domain-containing protein n=1 Tax=Escallonia rubra TaxID=112253 RepID=A0AA88U7U5_9ASTE|nr:hypothetical protein RJ640_016905 [Escallonia rubra]
MRSYKLPKDVVAEILSWLPVKSLVQFRSVSKHWNSLIQSDWFITQHRNNSRKSKGRLVVNYCHDYANKPNDIGFALYPDETLATPDFELFDQNLYRFQRVYGPCDGVFCLLIGSMSVVLWNPAMREYRQLPAWDIHSSLAPDLFLVDVSFVLTIAACGFDPSANVLKVVWLKEVSVTRNHHILDCPKIDDYRVTLAAVWTPLGDSWRDVDVLVPAYPLFWEPLALHACTDGVLYWTAYNYERRQRVLISFHLGDEVFKETPLPDLIRENGYNLSRFALYNGSISWMCCYNHDSTINRSIHIWVMTEDYQWIKQFSIGPISMTIIPLGIWNNGNLIVSGWDSQLFSVDPNTLHMKDLGLQGNRIKTRAITFDIANRIRPLENKQKVVNGFSQHPHRCVRHCKGGNQQKKGNIVNLCFICMALHTVQPFSLAKNSSRIKQLSTLKVQYKLSYDVQPSKS